MLATVTLEELRMDAQSDLGGIHQVIVGGESGQHMEQGSTRWMNMEWARSVRDQCVARDVAFFFKQDSGKQAGQRPYIVEVDGSQTQWQQEPNNYMTPLVIKDAKPVAKVALPLKQLSFI